MGMNVVLQPLITEDSVRQVEKNKLTFVVSGKANKRTIKELVESLYGVKVSKVNVCNTHKGKKKVYVTLAPEYVADEVAGRIGIL
ncbi:MAG: 50S ribosomal protein L23 [Methanobacteriota archaeon]|nr:MAG: 50S ribosomal protein L23 [Euryarchaeota archaeon]